MKVAVCLSGQPRFAEHAYPNIYETLIKPNNADVFFHCWYDKELVGKPYVNYHVNGWDYSNNKSQYQNNMDELLLNLYKPKKYIFENEKNFIDTKLELDDILKTHARHYTREYFVNMLYSSWYSINKSNLLKEQYRLENDVKYDFIIRARFDTTLNHIINCSMLNKEYLYTDTRPSLPPRMIEDWFAIGSNKIMNIYSSAFNYMEYAVDISNKYDKIFCGETLVYEMVRVFNIPHVRISNLIHTPIRQNMI
jgi:hypothetical protein